MVLETLRDHDEPMTLTALGDATSLHTNTLRDHVQALRTAGEVRRVRSAPVGRGRPAWLYQAVRPRGLPGRGDYAGLAAVLAGALSSRSGRPWDESVSAGTVWGEQLASATAQGLDGGGPGAPRHAVVGLLSELGFAPEPNRSATSVRLTRCPLLEAARLEPEVVCGVHEGIVRGALEHWGDTSTEVELAAFAERGACRLRLNPDPERRRGASSGPGSGPPAGG